MTGTRSTDSKEGKAAVKVVFYTHKTLSNGSHPFIVRITKNRKNRWVSTGLSILPKYWNNTYSNYRDAIRKSYPAKQRAELIEKLDEWQKKYTKATETLASTDEVHDANAVANKAVEERKQTRNTTLLAYIDTLVESMIKAGQRGNSIVYQDLRNQLAKFIANEINTTDISFDKVTVRFCHEWEVSLRTTGDSDNTLSNRFRTLRAVLNKAIANSYPKPESYPFARNVAEKHKFNISRFDTSTIKRAVSRDSIRKIENYQPTGTHTGPYSEVKNQAEIERLSRAKDVFLFSFYVDGINFVELAKLRWSNIQLDNEGHYRLNYTRQKTGGKFSLKIIAPALAIIQKYRSETYLGPDNYIFPILDYRIHITPNMINNRLHKVVGQTNQDLKIIGQHIDLSIPLTTYVARHSFATSLKQAGHANAVIGQAMGHKDESTTNIYIDSFGSGSVDAAFDSLL